MQLVLRAGAGYGTGLGQAGVGGRVLPLPDLHLVDPPSRSDRLDRGQPGGQEAPALFQSPDPGC